MEIAEAMFALEAVWISSVVEARRSICSLRADRRDGDGLASGAEGLGERELTRIAIALITSASCALIPVANVRHSNMLHRREWLGSVLGGKRECSASSF